MPGKLCPKYTPPVYCDPFPFPNPFATPQADCIPRPIQTPDPNRTPRPFNTPHPKPTPKH
jgi:hypothetical protein